MKIVYWSGTGNTQKMANLIAEGIIEKGKEAEIISVSDANPDIFQDEDVLILGCAAMGDETLEEDEFDPFIEEISSKVSGKKVALFGSYGWGDGTWLRNFEERMISYGCQSTLDLLMVENEPEGPSEDECREFGRKIASL